MTGKLILKSNCVILFEELKKAVDNYIKFGHTRGETQYINAFLAATIHSFLDYADRYLNKEDEKIQACRYVNNTLKHNISLVTHCKTVGGFTFPINFQHFVSPKIDVIWNYDESIKTRYEDQQLAFKKLFAGKPIIDTLLPLASEIDDS